MHLNHSKTIPLPWSTEKLSSTGRLEKPDPGAKKVGDRCLTVSRLWSLQGEDNEFCHLFLFCFGSTTLSPHYRDILHRYQPCSGQDFPSLLFYQILKQYRSKTFIKISHTFLTKHTTGLFFCLFLPCALFKTALLRFTLHTIKYIHMKCTIQRFFFFFFSKFTELCNHH